MRLAIIGNSHIASLQMAWKAGLKDQFPTVEITFFGAVRNTLMTLRSKDGCLASHDQEVTESLKTTSGGFGQIDPGNFDCILVFGLCRGATQVLDTLNGPFSEAVKTQALVDFWRNCNNFRLISKIRRLTDIPIFAGHDPLISTADARPAGKFPYESFIAKSNALAFADIDAELFPQSAQTIVNENATDARFSRRGLKLAVKGRAEGERHAEDEHNHMNEDFGRLWLEHFLSDQRIAELV